MVRAEDFDSSIVGSNPATPANKKELLSTRSSFFVYPSRRLGISSPHEVRCISSAPAGLYLITRKRASYLRLDDIPQQVADDIQGYPEDFTFKIKFERIEVVRT